MGKNEEAIDCYNEAIRLDPNYTEAYYNKGGVLYELGKSEEALDCFNEAIRTNPKFSNAYCFKGVVLRKMGKNQKAMGCFNQAIHLNPKDKTALMNKRRALVKNKNTKGVMNSFDKPISLDASKLWFFSAKGEVLYQMARKKTKKLWIALRKPPVYILVILMLVMIGNVLNALGKKG